MQIITDDEEDTLEMEYGKVDVAPIWKWLVLRK